MKMNDKTVLITGSTDGVGRYVATELAAAGAQVLIHGRDAARAMALIDEIKRAGGTTPDLLSSRPVVARRYAKAGRGRARRSQATRRVRQQRRHRFAERGPGAETSKDGYELRFAVNYLAGFLLVHLLLPLLKASAPSRIVNVASLGQHPIDFDDVMITRGYSGSRAYAQSKLSQIMLTIDLADKLKGSGVTVNALHPATYMNTTMVRAGGTTPMSTVEQGGDAILHLVRGDDVAGKSGLFFNGMNEAKAHPQAYDAAARRRLMTLSRELAGLPAA